MKIDKNELLSELLFQSTTHLAQTEELIECSEAQLLKPAANGGWSIVECFEHLNTYFRYYLPLIDKAVEKLTFDNGNEYKSGWLGEYMIGLMETTKKYKAAKKHIPAVEVSAHEVLDEFIGRQRHFINLVNRSKDKNLSTPRIPTSINQYLKLKLGDIFRFIVIHNERHIHQANRNLPIRKTELEAVV